MCKTLKVSQYNILLFGQHSKYPKRISSYVDNTHSVPKYYPLIWTTLTVFQNIILLLGQHSKYPKIISSYVDKTQCPKILSSYLDNTQSIPK
jgi:hypothetical protein